MKTQKVKEVLREKVVDPNQILVALKKTTVCGFPCFYAKCLTCKWESIRYHKESIAWKRCRSHRCKPTNLEDEE